jgi:threonine/homoserine/homoserine lactone efflux protein
MTDVVVSGLLAGYGVAVPVGAIAVAVIGLTARTSFRVGAAAALGVAAADGIYAAAAVLGGAALARLIEPVGGPLRWVAAAVLGWLAGTTAIRAIRHHRDPLRARDADPRMSTPGRAFAGLLGLTLLNPMTVIYFSALVVGRQAGAGDAAGGAVFVAAVAAASASWQLLVAGSGSLLGRLLTGTRGRLVTALGSSGLIIVLAVRLVLG